MPVRRARPPIAPGANAATEGGVVAGMAQPGAAPVARAAGIEATTPATRAPAWLLAMKIFFAVISLSLLLSVLSGLVIAYRISHRPHLLNALVLAGTLLPIVLLL